MCACGAEKQEHLLLLATCFHMRQLEAVHAVLSSFALVAPYVHSSREEELYQSHSTNELVVPNGLAPCPGTPAVPRGWVGTCLCVIRAE